MSWAGSLSPDFIKSVTDSCADMALSPPKASTAAAMRDRIDASFIGTKRSLAKAVPADYAQISGKSTAA
jgi:hypothetical protein